MGKPVVGVQPSILRWAREMQGFSEEEVAKHLKREAAEIVSWEKGDSAPTYSQLEDLAYRLYKRPLAVFFLPAPPSEAKVKEEFRTLPDFELDQLAADTRYQIRLAHAFQQSLMELNDGTNPAEMKIFRDLKLTVAADVREAARTIRAYLGIPLSVQTTWKVAEAALKTWRRNLEEVGVYIFKHSFKQKEISGFCLAHIEFPLIYINNSTSKTRQIFTLFHELGHLLLRVNSISMFDDSYVDTLPPRERRVERFCNALAAEFLMPTEDFERYANSLKKVNDEMLEVLSLRYHVSREVVLRRFLDMGRISSAYYAAKVKQWNNEYEAGGSGGNYYSTQAAYLGEAYLRLVFSNLYQGRITLEQAADHLGVKTKSISGLEGLIYDKAVAR